MSARTSVLCFATISLLLALLTAVPTAAWSDCTPGLPLEPGETWRDPGSGSGAARFTVDVPAAGLLVFQLLVPAATPGAHLSLVGEGDSQSAVLHHTPTTLVLLAEPGRRHLRVATDDPREALAPFRLRFDRLAPASRDGHKGERDSEIELEPDPLVASGPRPAEDLSQAYGLSRFQVQRLCRQAGREQPQDDAADGFFCATPLPWRKALEGRIDNPWGDDVDTFRFEIASLKVVELLIQAVDGGELTAALYDETGQRLEVVQGGDGESRTLRLVRALGPGAYFLRLESLTDPTAYTLRLDRGRE